MNRKHPYRNPTQRRRRSALRRLTYDNPLTWVQCLRQIQCWIAVGASVKRFCNDRFLLARMNYWVHGDKAFVATEWGIS
jgi:hypothetical protein